MLYIYSSTWVNPIWHNYQFNTGLRSVSIVCLHALSLYSPLCLIYHSWLCISFKLHSCWNVLDLLSPMLQWYCVSAVLWVGPHLSSSSFWWLLLSRQITLWDASLGAIISVGTLGIKQTHNSNSPNIHTHIHTHTTMTLINTISLNRLSCQTKSNQPVTV